MLKDLVPTIRKESKRIIAFRIVLLLLIVLNLSLIWVNSAKVSDDSNKASKSIAETVAKKVVRDYDTLPEEQQKNHVSKLNTKIRSMAHFGEFVPLGLLLYLLSLSLFSEKRSKWYLPLFSLLFSVVMAAIFALFDEIHQIFVSGRSFQLIDIAADTSGAFCASVLCVLVRSIRSILKEK